LLGEVTTNEDYTLLSKFSKRLFILAVISGLGIFVTSYLTDLVFHKTFFNYPISISLGVLSTLLVPFIFQLIRNRNVWHFIGQVTYGFKKE